jgi:nucleoside-diphosphate-sugar epimerase
MGLSMVTGANGHLGNNLVRALRAQGDAVRAGVRDPSHAEPLEGTGAQVVRADLLDQASLARALEGVETLFQVAAVFRHWSRDPDRDIVVPNVTGTRNVLQAAAVAGTRRIVYVSSIAALDRSAMSAGPLAEDSWCADDRGSPYFRSKAVSELLAWRLAGELGLDMVSILPSAMAGPHAYRLTPTMRLLDAVLRGRLPAAPDVRLNFVDVRDVAAGMIAAAEKGRPGERYILAGDESMGLRRLAELAREISPAVRLPLLLPRSVVMPAAGLMERWARLTGQEPALQRSQVRLFAGTDENLDSGKACRELGWQARSSQQAVRECLAYLKSQAPA